MFEQDFNFLIFSCFGDSVFTDVIMQELAYLRFVTVNMLPCSIAAGIVETKQNAGKTRLIGTQRIPYLQDELTELSAGGGWCYSGKTNID